jgi:hypothetical protein
MHGGIIQKDRTVASGTAAGAAKVFNPLLVATAGAPFAQDCIERRQVIVMCALARDENILIVLTAQAVFPQAANEHVASATAVQLIIAIAADKHVVATRRHQPVISISAKQHGVEPWPTYDSKAVVPGLSEDDNTSNVAIDALPDADVLVAFIDLYVQEVTSD